MKKHEETVNRGIVNIDLHIRLQVFGGKERGRINRGTVNRGMTVLGDDKRNENGISSMNTGILAASSVILINRELILGHPVI